MKIDSQLKLALDLVLATYPEGLNSPSTPDGRRKLLGELLSNNPVNQSVYREDLEILNEIDGNQVPIRVYTPKKPSRNSHAILFVIHGGGMVMGDLETDDSNAAFLCETLGIKTIALEYRLAPEFPYPSGLNDCLAVANWIFANLEFEKIGLFGGSAGGNLAISLSARIRDLGLPNFDLVMAPYPMLDDSNTSNSSHEVLNLGVWDRQANIESWHWYLGEKNRDLTYAIPANFKNLAGLPPLFIDVGSCDLFIDENKAFVEKVLSQGGEVEFHTYEGAFHASELFAPDADISQRMWQKRFAVLVKFLALKSIG